MTDYTELKRLAEAASRPGFRWMTGFTLATGPDVILALIAESERLERLALDSVNEEYAAQMNLESICAERDQLKAENEALRKYGEEFAVLAERRREEVEALRKLMGDFPGFSTGSRDYEREWLEAWRVAMSNGGQS
ncbi:hypothetical protein [Pseudomonas gingeri]